MTNNATCSICGRPYYKCISCKDAMKNSPYKIFTDTAEHYKVFQVIRGFSTGVYTKDEAMKKFKNVDLRDMDTFRPHIKSLIKDILKEDKKVVKSIVEPVVKEEAKVEPVVQVDEVNSQIMSYSRKRNLDVNNIVDNVEAE